MHVSRWLVVAALLAAAAAQAGRPPRRRQGVRARGERPGRGDRPLGRISTNAAVAAAALAVGGAARVMGGRGPFDAALQLGDAAANASRDDCVWRRGPERDRCPDPDVKYYLYTGPVDAPRREVVDMAQRDWLRRSGWEPAFDNVVLVHGYGGGDEEITSDLLRKAYLRHGQYNVFSVDWGALSRLPCYPAAVHNMRSVARCTAQLLTFLRDSGLQAERTACVGHSLGAHLCGLTAHYLTFRMQRIVALDPAKPLIRLQNKLSPGDATAVHVLHTNAGHYGESGRVGHVDFCINGGRLQPFCENATNPNLCSHARSVCYLAESISRKHMRLAEPCGRRCPSGLRGGAARISQPIPMGMHTPFNAAGSFCVSNVDEPYCNMDRRCCSKTAAQWTAPEDNYAIDQGE